MGFGLTTCTVAFTILYFRKVKMGFLREGCLLGLAFVACNLLFDLPMFSAGPMQMPLLRYLKDIGIAYLSMPMISIGVGYVLQTHTNNVRRFSASSSRSRALRRSVPHSVVLATHDITDQSAPTFHKPSCAT